MPNSKDFWGKQLPAWLNHPGTKPSIFHPSAPNKHYGLLKRKHGGDLLRGKVLFLAWKATGEAALNACYVTRAFFRTIDSCLHFLFAYGLLKEQKLRGIGIGVSKNR